MNFFNKIIQKSTQLSQKIKNINQKPEVTKITNQIYHCPYPNNVQQLKNALKEFPGKRASVWNLSQYAYSKELKQKLQEQGLQINQITYQYYSSLPLTIGIVEAKKLQLQLNESSDNIAFIHCQQNHSRSIIFLASYLYLSGKMTDVASALEFVNAKLGIKTNQTVYSTQHTILRNIANYNKDPTCINKQQLKLVKVIINEAPELDFIDLTLDQQLPTFIQIHHNDKVIYKKLTKQFGQGQITHFDLKNQNIILSDDCLFRFKYVYQKKIYPILRINLNTNFIFNNFIRVQMNQIDICKNAKVKNPIFADFLFQTVKGTQSELSKLQTEIKRLDSQKKQIILQKNKKKSPQKSQQKQVKIPAQIKKAENKTQKSQSSSVSPTTKKSSQMLSEQQSNFFHIHDHDQQKGQVTQQSINKMLDSMAMKKANITQQIQEAANQQDQEGFQKKLNKKQEKNKQNPLKKSQNNQSLQNSLQKTQSSNSGLKNQQKSGQYSGDDVDMDDYLSKLQQEAENL